MYKNLYKSSVLFFMTERSMTLFHNLFTLSFISIHNFISMYSVHLLWIEVIFSLPFRSYDFELPFAIAFHFFWNAVNRLFPFSSSLLYDFLCATDVTFLIRRQLIWTIKWKMNATKIIGEKIWWKTRIK